jgi:[acyl-carrier-protein] S-malonyltransferase
MTLGYFFKAGATFEAQGLDLYDQFPAMRDWCDQVAEWTGTTAADLLSQQLEEGAYIALPQLLRNAIVSLGIADILAERGIRPTAIAGWCAGMMPAACVAGCIDRRDLIELISGGPLGSQEGFQDPADDRPEAMAQIAFPADTPAAQIEWYYGDEWPGVYLAVDSGLLADGSYRIISVAGYLDDLERLAEAVPRKENFRIIGTYGATHSPLHRPLQEFMSRHILATPIRDPVLPLYSGLGAELLTTADQVVDALIRGYTDPVWLDHVRLGMKQAGVRTMIALGPGTPRRLPFLQWPFEVAEVLTAKDVAGFAAAAVA